MWYGFFKIIFKILVVVDEFQELPVKIDFW